MSESMPIMANTAAASQSKDALSTATATSGTEAGAASGDFTELLDAQLQLAEEDVSAFPTELLNISDDVESLTAVPAPGNDLPLVAANPAQAVMTPAEIFPTQNNSLAGLNTPVSATSEKPLNISNAGNESAKVASGINLNPDEAVNMDDMLMARQQQHLMQAASNSKDSPLFESALNQQLSNEPASSSASNSSLQNLSGLAGLSAGVAAKSDAMPTLTPAPLTVPPQNPGWNQSVGDRLQWMVGQNLQSAEIRLDPPELGSMEVRVQINKDHASIVFSAPNQQVRDALEAAIPRLREMMNDIGLSLGDVNVSQESFTQQQQTNEQAAAVSNISANSESEIDGSEMLSSVVPRRGQGILDAYA